MDLFNYININYAYWFLPGISKIHTHTAAYKQFELTVHFKKHNLKQFGKWLTINTIKPSIA